MLAFVLVSLALSAGVEPRVYALDAGLDVWDVSIADFNGDKRGDIAAICADPVSRPVKKQLALFLADEQGAYPAKPTVIQQLDPLVGALFTAEVSGAAPVEIAAVSADGCKAFGLSDGKLSVVRDIPFVSLYPSGSKQPAFLEKAAIDLNGDGLDEWLAPMPMGFDVRNAEGLLASVHCDVDSGVRTGSGMEISNKYPACKAFELPGQKSKAIAFLSDENADFAFGEGWGETKRFKIPINLDDKWDTSADMNDINGDGFPDLIVTQTQGTINLSVLTQVYIATGPMEYPNEPNARFESKGSFAAPILKDVNGDKKLDVVFINIPFGVKFFVNYFMFKQVGVDLQIYLYNGTGFGKKPDYSTSVSIAAPDGKEQNAYVLGDFNGDGNTDAAFGAGADKLLLHGGGDVKFISPKPYASITVPSFGVARACKLNDNAAEDIVIIHPGIKNKERIEVLVF